MVPAGTLGILVVMILRKLKFKIGRRHVFALAIVGIAMVPIVAIVGAAAVIKPYESYILANANNLSEQDQSVKSMQVPTGLVLGAGIDANGRPYKELRARLDVAALALERGDVQRLILSGDNRFAYYDEPTAMKKYLMDTYSIGSNKLQPDYAGRSTYESCQRAAQVFNQTKLILFSAESHLPRAIYLCRSFGIETYGIASVTEANNAARREAVARVKAIYNVHINGEPTILGAPIRLR